MYLDCKTIVIGQHLICLFEFGKTVQIVCLNLEKQYKYFFEVKKKKSTCFWMYLYVCRFNMYEIHILYLNCVY